MEHGSKIKTILALFKEGKTKKEIIDMGFNKATVNIQINKFIKQQNESDSSS